MGTLISPAKTVVDNIPLGRRILEIMKEKGGYYSITAMAARLGYNRETLRLMLKGEREIYSFELEKIASDLKLPVERITQEDIKKDASRLKELLSNKSSLEDAVEIATQLIDLAIGTTEKCNAINNLSIAFFHLENYEKCYNLWMDAYHISELIAQRSDDKSRQYVILSNLITLFTARKEYSKLTDLLQRVEGVFDEEPEKQGTIYFSKAMIAEEYGDIEQAEKYLNKTLECLIQTGHENKIGRAKLNLGYFEYKRKRYSVAEQLLNEAIDHLQTDVRTRTIAVKELAKTLIKLDKRHEASEVLQQEVDGIQGTDMIAKYHLLLAIAKNEPKNAETILGQDVSDKVRKIICKYLLHHYYTIGDSEAVMRYYGIAESLEITNSDVLHEEDL